MKLHKVFASAALLSLLAACGGGSNSSVDEPLAADGHRVPASALGSASAYSTYTGSLAATEAGEPLRVEGMVPPSSETDQPIGVN